MGPYCNYCQRRCFLTRLHPETGVEGLFATCQAGMAFDRERTGGYDHTNTVNPSVARLAAEKRARIEHGGVTVKAADLYRRELARTGSAVAAANALRGALYSESLV